MGAGQGINNPNNLIYLYNMYFLMKMNPHIEFINGQKNPFFWGNMNFCNFGGIKMNNNIGIGMNNMNFNMNMKNMNSINNMNNWNMNNWNMNNMNNMKMNNMNMNQMNNMNMNRVNNMNMNQMNNMNMNRINNMNMNQMNNMNMNQMNNMNMNQMNNMNMNQMNNMNNMKMNQMNNKNMNNMNMNQINNMNNMNMNQMNNINMNKMNMNQMNMNQINMNNMNLNNMKKSNDNNLLSNINQKISSLDDRKKNLIIDAFNETINFSSPSSNIDNNNLANLEKEITMRFLFTNNITIPVKGKLNEKFIDVFKRFQKNQCPEPLKKFSPLALHETILVENEKTLSENNIKDGDPILFFNSKEIGATAKKKNELTETKSTENSTLREEKKEILKKWLIEFQSIKFLEYLKKIVNMSENSETPPSFKFKVDFDEFIEFVKKKSSELGIEIEEHEHKLIFCLTNFDWSCDECKQKYNKKVGRYYCSICNYNMCDQCIENQDYKKMKPFPEDAVPSNENVTENVKKGSHHEHQLVYCTTKRTCISSAWICDVCKKDFNRDKWSFYCTCCDFDQCFECMSNDC